MNKVYILEHPLIQHKLTHIRKKTTNTKEFREYLHELTCLIAYEVFKNIKLKEIPIETPMAKTTGKVVDNSINLFPILRAGQGMVNGFLTMVPNSKVGHIGMYRDEKSLKPVKYLFKYPKTSSKDSLNIILDPIIATGGSILAALETLHEKGFTKNIKIVAIITTNDALLKITKQYPNVEIYAAAIDSKLNKNGYIVPGIGDSGDRIFGTK